MNSACLYASFSEVVSRIKIPESQVGTSQKKPQSLAASWQALLARGPEFNEHE